jgi:hypothetical protein
MATPGTLESIVDRIAEILGDLSFSRTVFNQDPGAIQDFQLPAWVITALPDVRKSEPAYDSLQTERRIGFTLYWQQTGAHPSETPIGTSLWGVIDAVDETFHRDRLCGDDGLPMDGVTATTPPLDGGIQTLPYGEAGTLYTAIPFTIDVRILRTFAP